MNQATRPNQSARFYEEKGMARQMVIMSQESKATLKDVAKTYRLSQGELIDVLLENAVWDSLTTQMEAKRNEKVSSRVKKVSMAKKLEGLTPEQLAAVEAIIAGTK